MNSKSRHFTGNSMALKKDAFFQAIIFSNSGVHETNSSSSVKDYIFCVCANIHVPSSSSNPLQQFLHDSSEVHSAFQECHTTVKRLLSWLVSFFPASISGRNISHTIARSSARNKPDKVHMSLTFHLQCRQLKVLDTVGSRCQIIYSMG